jgi:hypothetical protein
MGIVPRFRHSGVTRTFPSQRRDIEAKTLVINRFLSEASLRLGDPHG